jgi:peptide/nickel transport system substrate-binding protein
LNEKRNIGGRNGMKMRLILSFLGFSAVMVAVLGCAAEEVIVEREVIKEVPVERIVEKEVVKEVVVEKVVEKEVVVVATPTRAEFNATQGFVLRASEPNPKRGGVVRTAWTAKMSNFDVQMGGGPHILSPLYNKLVAKNYSDGYRSIIPDLATGWKRSADGKTYNFTLREGVSFHNGDPFNADDVIATYDRIINTPEGITARSKDLIPMIASVEKVNDYEVQFNLHDPTPYLVELLTNGNLLIYSDVELEANGQDLRPIEVPTGTGLMKFVSHTPGEIWKYEANTDFFNPELPYLDGVNLLNVPLWPDRGAAVLTGQADFSWNISPDTHKEAIKRPDLDANTVDCLNSHNFAINNDKAPYDDVRVRKALHLGVSRQNQINGYTPVWEPTFVTRWIPVPSPYATGLSAIAEMPGYRENKTEDIIAAKKLLAEAGFPNGFDMEITTWNQPQTADVAVPLFADDVKKNLGINASVKLVERSLQSEILADGNFELFRNGDFAGQILDPYPMWNLYLRTGATQNWSRYANPEFDAILDKLAGELDGAARGDLFNQGMDILDDNPPFYHIGFCQHSPAWARYVKGAAMESRLHTYWERFDTLWLDR